jgi:PAS domain-containing protein
LVLDGELGVEAANRAFLQHFRVESAETLGCLVYDLGNGQWNISGLRRLLEEVLSKDGKVTTGWSTSVRALCCSTAPECGARTRPTPSSFAITDITERERLRGKKEFTEKLIDSVRESLVVLGLDPRVHFANRTFYQHFAVAREETEGHLIYELGNGQWDILGPDRLQLRADNVAQIDRSGRVHHQKVLYPRERT